VYLGGRAGAGAHFLQLRLRGMELAFGRRTIQGRGRAVPGLAQTRLGGAQVGLGLPNLELEIMIAEPRQRLAGAHLVAGLD
jgi:hypothetical protein